MSAVASALVAATRQQLAHRRGLLAAGATHIGWKLGTGTRERIGPGPVVGHLTTATVLASGAGFDDGGLAAALHADVEVALQLRVDVDPDAGASAACAAIGSYATALEIVDLAPVLDGPVAIVATNVFHRAVAFGPWRPALQTGARGSARVNGAPRGAGEPADLAERLLGAARVLAAAGEAIRAGDRIITGSVVQIPVARGDEVEGEVNGLGSARLMIAGRVR